MAAKCSAHSSRPRVLKAAASAVGARRPLRRVVGRRHVGEAQPVDQCRPELRLQRTDRDVAAVRTLVAAVVRRAAVEQVGPAPVRPAAGGEERARHRGEIGGALGHRGVDDLTLPARAGMGERGEQARHEEHRAAAEVGDVVDRRDGRPVRGADAVQHAADREVGDVVPGGRGERAVLAPTGHPPVDQPRIAGVHVRRPDAEPFRDTWPEAFDEQVGGVAQPQHDLGAAGPPHVHRDRAPAPAQRSGGQRVERTGGAELVDAHHVRAQVGEQHAGERDRPDRRQLDDPYSFSGPGTFTPRTPRVVSYARVVRIELTTVRN